VGGVKPSVRETAPVARLGVVNPRSLVRIRFGALRGEEHRREGGGGGGEGGGQGGEA